jgi:alkylhydroperoxidase family enzyme
LLLDGLVGELPKRHTRRIGKINSQVARHLTDRRSMMRWLLVHVLFAVTVWPATARPDSQPGQFPFADNDAAWAKLPRDNPPLPPWAKVLVGPLPKTVAKMLELDYFHREKNPLGRQLSACLRWTAADALGSDFGKATAEADLRRAGVPAAVMAKLGQNDALAPDVRVATAFTRKLTLEGHAITDAEFAELLKIYGPEKVTAIVHTVAYANFHNRVVLGLGAVGGPVPPVDAKFNPERLAKVATPARPPWDDLKSVKSGGLSVAVDWSKARASDLILALEKQKGRNLRIPLPDPSLLRDLPTKEREEAERVVWSNISSGYQPEMPRVWFATMRTFYEEAKFDRVFSNSVFWVVTRTNDCFY